MNNSKFENIDTIAGIIGIILIVLCIMLLQGAIFMVLWNWLIPSMFGFTKLSFIKSVGFMILLNFIGSAFRTKGKN